MLATPETTVSLRWAIPFLRVTGASPQNLEILRREGIELKDFGSSDTRVRHRVMMELLAAAVERVHDPLLGIRAGERIEPGDFETLEFACRSCENLRESILCAGRYMYLMHGGQESRLIEDGERASWELRIVDDVPQLPAANDFALVAACWLARRHTGERQALWEVHFTHQTATSSAEYARVFDGARIRLGMPHNALVFPRANLDTRLTLAHPGLKAAFEEHADAMLQRLKREDTFEGRVRRLVIELLATGDADMPTIARRLAMSVATLRRRLSDEGTSHTQILDDVRRTLSQKYLVEQKLSISEVAFLLGFAHVTAFYKAFRRWSQGATPAEYRAESQRRV
ncbi:MAG: Transcriptional regulator, AraC family [Myxococcaceae bacterium]|nr:Transcriptional regulator, AraC family [Myxococcaceae bacterium]